ncbi:hypothetical protein CRE_08970 [Caenorhabditis remanei]|uniref:Integrase catalytic domain-containing protein n=1 Tax=Caenorhabditis remanei TaxID=31234 RepID=E3LIJ1_CAERE|nr:hypothetical protein CRE_08970 [Caenorhabditis remanei]
MAEKTAGIPQSSNTGESVGRTVTGPLKRIIDNTVYAASRHASSTKRFLTNIKNSTTTPNMGQLKRLDETLTETRKQITNLRALPDHVNAKKAHPLVLASVNKDKYLEEMDNYLAKTKYLTAISICTELIQQIEAELSEHGQPASPFDESIHDANAAVEQLGLLVIDPQTGDLIEEEGQPIEDIIVQLTNELEETKLLSQSLEEASENKKGDAEEPTPLADTEIEQQQPPKEGTAAHSADSNMNDRLEDLETDMEKAMLERQEKVAEGKRLRDEIATEKATIANKGVATPSPTISIEENKSTGQTLPKNDHQHPTMHETQHSSEQSQINNMRVIATHSQESLLSESIQSQLLQHISRLEQHVEKEKSNQNKFMNSVSANFEKIFNTLKKDNNRAKNTRLDSDDDITSSEDEDDYARRYMEGCNPRDDKSRDKSHRIPHSTPKKAPAHLKNVTFDSVKSNLVTFDGSDDFQIFRNTFNDYVIQNPNISKDHKWVLLKGQLKGKAAKFLYRLDEPEEAVRLTFKELENKFGKKCDRMELHNKLANLPFHPTDHHRMEDDLREHRMLLSQMKGRGMNVNDEMIIKQFCVKLPRDIRKQIVSMINEYKDRLTFDMVHDAVQRGISELQTEESFFEISTRQRIRNEIPAAIHAMDAQQSHPTGNHYRNNNYQQFNSNSNGTRNSSQTGGVPRHGSRQPTNGNFRNNYPQNNNYAQRAKPQLSSNKVVDTSGVTLDENYQPGHSGINLNIIRYSFPFSKPETQSTCNACNQPHNAIRCPLPSGEFRQALKQKGLCELCTGKSHKIENCTSRYMCGYCGGRHHMGACPQKEERNFFVATHETQLINSLSRAGAEAKSLLHVPQSALPPDSRATSSHNCSTNTNQPPDSSLKTVPTVTVSTNSTVVSSKTFISTDSTPSENQEFLKFLSQTTHHVNHVATPKHDESDRDYKLPFLCLHSHEGKPIRALVDTGATLSMIDHTAADKLGFEILGTTNITVTGFDSTVTIPSNAYKVPLKSKYSTTPVTIRIAGSPQLPPTRFRAPILSKKDLQYIQELNIPKSELNASRNQTGKRIDLILGNDVIAWFNSLATTTRHILPSGRLMETSPFGFIVHPTPDLGLLIQATHKLSNTSVDLDDENYIMTLMDYSDPEDPLSRLIAEVCQMWNIQNLGAKSPELDETFKKEQRDLMDEFNRNAKYNEKGEFEVALPLNGNEARLANNYEIAIKRLIHLIVTLKKGTNLLKQYNDIIQEQLAKGIISKVTPQMMEEERKRGQVVYNIPHRGVVKLSSMTTKLRIVYDASSHKRDQLSLNDCVFPGPSILQSIFGILIRARMYKYLVIADIEKAFHQVQMQEQFRSLTRFLWLKNIEHPATPDNIETFHFNKIPFGLACSPFLLAAVIHYFLTKNPNKLNDMTRENLYVDNCLYYTNDKGEIPEIVKAAKQIFDDMDMNLREFIVNEAEEMMKIPEKDRAASLSVKVLGYLWSSKEDTWTIKIAKLEESHPTKRQVASRLAETFDPLGLVTPILVGFKRLMQNCWLDGVKWNEPLPPQLLSDWRKVQEQFKDEEIVIPRELTPAYNFLDVRLMVFSDASKDMMAASVYALYTFEDKHPTISLICSKNKIRPSKNEKWTIPKLELMAIEIATNLAVATVNEIRLPITEVCFFTDSACALFWILTKKLTRPFVANRVEAIHTNKDILTKQNIEEVNIRHCPTKDNPADLATRGMSTSELQSSSLWFNGPAFLKTDRSEWPTKIEGVSENIKEFQALVFSEVVDPTTKKKKKSMLPLPTPTKPSETETILTASHDSKFQSIVPYTKTNSMRKLVSTMHSVMKFLVQSNPHHEWQSYIMKEFVRCKETSPTARRNLARTFVIQQHYLECKSQGYTFPQDMNAYQDQDGLYRYKRQVRSKVLPLEAREPILIHSKHPLAELIIRETHEINGHLPESYTISAARTKYWVLHDRQIAGRVIANCVQCKKVNGLPFAYPHSQALPQFRTEPSTPFEHSGIDYLGPIMYTRDDGSLSKAFILIYTCLVTRGARLEIIPDGTVERYLEAMSIVFSRSGIPKTIYSDNAKTFQLGEKIINEDIAGDEASESLTSFLANQEIDFIYITPLAPWQGGIYERIVKLVKHQLMKEIGDLKLDFQGLRRVLAGVEAMINSRPLTPHPKRPNDMVALRPIDFQLPAALIDLPFNTKPFEPTQSKTEQRTRAHLEQYENVLERLWKGWSLGYLLHLRESKHKNKRCSRIQPTVGQVVIINTNLVRRQKWPLGLIVKVCESKTGEIRSVIVKCKGKLYKRAVCQLIPLEIETLDKENCPKDQKDTETDPRYKSKPIPPSPAIFDIPNARYSPSYFTNSNDASHPDAIPHTAELPIIGEKVVDEEEIDYDLHDLEQEDDDMATSYQDPNAPAAHRLDIIDQPILHPHRTREYLPRKAKAPYVNYVHHMTVRHLSFSGPPECCQFDASGMQPANFVAL